MFSHRTPCVHIEQYRNVVHGDEATYCRNAYQYPFIRDGLNRRHFENMEVQATSHTPLYQVYTDPIKHEILRIGQETREYANQLQNLLDVALPEALHCIVNKT
ncbi:unnamed protein product [Brachionus calyciflorus]|uniref:Uncharacterized protein n=1 Tax=Brachionus calyciflorus TaxID=104777 RepID=A0A813VF44_9BILA|nr:unnamed protein product [Brachionus calyciflorus]